MAHAESEMNNTFKFQDIWTMLIRVKACTDRQTNGRRDKPHASTLLNFVGKR